MPVLTNKHKPKQMLYVIDTSKEFNGRVLNTANDDGKVHYMDKPTTFDEYNAANGGNLALLTWEELEPLADKYVQSLISDWEQIDEDRWYEMLEVLPPLKWRNIAPKVNCFFISEATFASVHGCFIRDNRDGTFWECREDVSKHPQELYERYDKQRKASHV